MIKIKFYSLLRWELKCSELDIDATGISIREVINEAEKKIGKKIFHLITDAEAKLSRGTIILINGRNIVHLQEFATIVRSDDLISIFPPGGGG
ncbi:MAG: hypothetical protein APR54_04415 [Candidatus Cloacimonas sp. SDB]|nr:MAG: hypothetical protein APR54_04415 [Candidatus Cloacimonas sp. SDB]